MRKVKIFAFWPFLNDFDTTEGSRRGQGAQEVSEGLLGTVWFDPIRHLPTAGVCDRPTAGVCDQHLGVLLRHLPTAGVFDQH